MADQALLPPNASAWQRAAATTFARVQTLPVGIITTVKQPATCPAMLLPWLAAERGVSEWDRDWTEDGKRAVIAGSYPLKARNATRWAVVGAIAQLGMSVAYQSWMQYGGQPYRFRLAVQLGGSGTWSRDKHQLLLNTVYKAKAVRSRLETVSLERTPTPGPIAIGGALAIGLTLTIEPKPLDLVAPPGAHISLGGYTAISTGTTLQ